MTAIADIANETLRQAQQEIYQARRRLLLAALLLALVHLLTVTPYLDATRQSQELRQEMEQTRLLLSEVEPEIERLKSAEKAVGEEVEKLVGGATERMIDGFRSLREAMAEVRTGAASPASTPAPVSQMPIQAQMPPSDASQPVDDPELNRLLVAVVDGEPGAGERLEEWAVEQIVRPAYARVEERWEQDVLPEYLQALDATVEGARQVADEAKISAPDIAAQLGEAADTLLAKREDVEQVDVAPGETGLVPVDPGFWQTVEGKRSVADQIQQAVAERFHELSGVADGIAAPITRALELQQDLRAQMQEKQMDLEAQFAAQRARLSSITGSDVLPVELDAFVALFPLFLGLILGLLMMRRADARGEAAAAAAALQAAPDDERAVGHWLVGRAFGGGAGGAETETIALGTGAALWIALAAYAAAGIIRDPPIPVLLAAIVGVLSVLFASARDLNAIRRLEAVRLKLNP
ncbi:MAG TPA: hypothetical protein VMM55_09445 [Thermohalobaculum sp.]|nr:hypothetical protein [Thermohalobaculum sp.]